ncbi:hypothetical protein ACMU_04475 [Actibacterium mucosum KCTC 23349]|uniref:Uncharacterized protein n=1 Tax=Actibacterium mucosum KCTC 23349 TaxID=1454373 RepID=A0A037ZD06_9RHOB|nr:hypothetical protein ACMU_04475 [Actibacterium mucosum KCTC 23349]
MSLCAVRDQLDQSLLKFPKLRQFRLNVREMLASKSLDRLTCIGRCIGEIAKRNCVLDGEPKITASFDEAKL